MKIPLIDTSNVGTWEDLRRFGSQLFSSLTGAVNNGLNFSDNFDGKVVDMVSSVINTDVQINHGLGRVPQGYVVLKASVGGVVYDGSASSDSSYIYLKSTVAGTYKLLIF